MAKASLSTLARYCDRLLRTVRFTDYSGAVNGLQVENRGTVRRLAAAVDASPATVRMAIDTKADLLIVHHGLFWNTRRPWTGKTYELLRLLLDHDLAVYSSHLPLDAHPKLGNAAQLAAALGLKNLRPFFFDKGQHLGFQAVSRLDRKALVGRLTKSLGHPPTVLPGGPERCRKIGIVTGGAGAELTLAKNEDVDTFITGEGPHWTYALAEEQEINVLYGGHYATETFGVKALTQNLARQFRLPWSFLDHPTGL